MSIARQMSVVAIVAASGLAACAGASAGPGLSVLPVLATVAPAELSPVDLSSGRRLRVVATTSLLAQAAGAVGGDRIDLTILVPTGADPHDYEPSPQDVVRLNNADVIMMSGLGYEVFLTKLLGGTENHPPVVALSDGVPPLLLSDELAAQPAAAGKPDTGELDPHVWFDPNNVIRWTNNAGQAFSALDPGQAPFYQASTSTYIAQLQELDQWAEDQLKGVPENQRKLVADHEVLGYLARRYGFSVVGAITAEGSDAAEPSPQELAALESTLQSQGVQAIFVGLYDNHSLADQVGRDTSIKVVPIYFESLSPPGGPAASYLDFMRFDIRTIVEALR